MATSQIGLIGLGTMGAALASNIAEKGFPIAVWNRTTQVTRDFHAASGDLADRITPTETLDAFVQAIAEPRAIILMVPAGQPVDDQITALRPLLGANDLIIDAGNANFHDTNRRSAEAGDLPFMGIGVSGGEEGARHGPRSWVAGNVPIGIASPPYWKQSLQNTTANPVPHGWAKKARAISSKPFTTALNTLTCK